MNDSKDESVIKYNKNLIVKNDNIPNSSSKIERIVGSNKCSFVYFTVVSTFVAFRVYI